MKMLVKIAKTVQGHFALFTIAVAALAFFVPQTFLWAAKGMNIGMIVVMFGMSLTMEFSDFKQLVVRPKAMLMGLACVFLISSGVTFLVANILGLPAGLVIGLLLCGATPGGVITNVLTYIADGDVPLSVGLTSVGTLIAPIVTPAMAYLLVGRMTQVDGLGMIKSMLINVVLPLVVGLTIKALFKKAATKISEFSPLFSLIALAFVVGIIVSTNKDKLLAALSVKLLIAVLLFIIVPTAISFLLARLLKISVPQCRAIGIEVGFKNSILASIIAADVFREFPEAALPGIVIAVMAAVIGPIIGNIWAKTGGGLRAQAATSEGEKGST